MVLKPPASRHGSRRFAATALLAAAASLCCGAAAIVRAEPAVYLTPGENRRVERAQEVGRLAVGDPDIASVQIVSSRELLLLGRRAGRTNLILWTADGGSQEAAVRVDRDLSLLDQAIRDVHPGISVVSAPDRDAVVLRGVVPDAHYSQAAEAVARAYLRGSSSDRQRGGGLIVGRGRSAAGGDPGAGSGDDASEAAGGAAGDPGLDGADWSEQPDDAADPFRLPEPGGPGDARLINLIRVENLPPPIEQRLRDALAAAGGYAIRVRRITSGSLASDARDTFVLEGEIEDQTALVRALITAARVLDPDATADQIRVVADEAGALEGRRSAVSGGGGGGGLGGTSLSAGGSLGGGANVGRNNLSANVGRAKVLSLAGGQLLSFVTVKRLPQVRIEARLYEVNRSRLRRWSPNMSVLIGNTENVRLLPSVTSRLMQGDSSGSPRISKDEIQGALSLLSGGAIGGLQYVGDLFAVDLALDLLERESIARALARPSLSVLSGEIATFNAGGQIPIAVTVNTTTSAAAGTQLSSTVFADFGVQVAVRPLVGDDDMITLDVTPTISQPDFDLTADLVGSTGSEQPTTAFQTRALRTTTRLRDGQSFVVGGLMQTTTGRGSDFTPGLHQIPGLGWLAKSRDDQRDELDFVVVVSPSIVYEADPRASLWAFPDAAELFARRREKKRGGGELEARGRR